MAQILGKNFKGGKKKKIKIVSRPGGFGPKRFFWAKKKWVQFLGFFSLGKIHNLKRPWGGMGTKKPQKVKKKREKSK